MVDARKLAQRLIAIREVAGTLYTLTDDLLSQLEAETVCQHPENQREYISPFGARQEWRCKACGFTQKEGGDGPE